MDTERNNFDVDEAYPYGRWTYQRYELGSDFEYDMDRESPDEAEADQSGAQDMETWNGGDE